MLYVQVGGERLEAIPLDRKFKFWDPYVLKTRTLLI